MSDTKDLVENRKHESDREVKMRRERVPVHEQNILTGMNLEKGYTYRWVNDLYGRIESFMLAGWEIVEGNTHQTYSGKGREIETQRGSQMWRTVNTRSDAPCKDAVLMKIPDELFNEDQAHKSKKIEEDEKRIDPHGVIRKAQLMGPRANIINK